jgi:hypothetical protein
LPGLTQRPFSPTKFPHIPIPLINLRPIRTPFESLLHKKYLDKLSRLAVTYTVNIAFHPRPAYPSSLRDLCALSVSAVSFFHSRRSSRIALPLSCEKSQKLTPLFSQSSALLKKEHFANSFGISTFRTLLQNTGGVPAPSSSFLPLLTTHNSLFTNSFRIRSSEKRARNPFGMRSSKTLHLKSFRMCSSKKTGVGPPPSSTVKPPRSSRSVVGARHGTPCPLSFPSPHRRTYHSQSTGDSAIMPADQREQL